MKSLGIDLTGSSKRASGLALLDDHLVTYTKLVSEDWDIVMEVAISRADVVSIDAPLSLPENPNKIYRNCELELKRRGIGVYWCLLPSMEKLTKRGIALADALRRQGMDVIESYPGAAQDILKIPRKNKGVGVLAKALLDYGITGDLSGTHDELDAITAAIVGLYYLQGDYEALGTMIIPKKPKYEQGKLDLQHSTEKDREGT